MTNQQQIEALKKFTRHTIKQACWGNGVFDGGDIQYAAEKLGLIVKTEFDPGLHGDSNGNFAPGDTYYVFADWLRP